MNTTRGLRQPRSLPRWDPDDYAERSVVTPFAEAVTTARSDQNHGIFTVVQLFPAFTVFIRPRL